jgi:hypothetical protein
MDDEERQAQQDVPSQSQRDLADHRKSGEEPWPSLRTAFPGQDSEQLGGADLARRG